MATDTQTATALLDEAAAIVEAEWMRLEHDAELWREVADLFAEMTAARPAPPRPGVTTTARRRPCRPMGDVPPHWPRPGRLPMHVWATQRSPP
jgi:hypothetical protein